MLLFRIPYSVGLGRMVDGVVNDGLFCPVPQTQHLTIMSSELGPSTPSRKRSKWDEDIDGDIGLPVVPQQKRRAKFKPVRAAPNHSAPEPIQETHKAYAPSHSVYVPPRIRHPPIQPSRSVYAYERLNQIEEGSYGVVFRARDKQTGDIVALKKLKLDEEKNGFPITALREVYALMSCRHENVVSVRDVVVGDTLTQCVPNFHLARLHVVITNFLSRSMSKSLRCDGLYRT